MNAFDLEIARIRRRTAIICSAIYVTGALIALAMVLIRFH